MNILYGSSYIYCTGSIRICLIIWHIQRRNEALAKESPDAGAEHPDAFITSYGTQSLSTEPRLIAPLFRIPMV